MKVDPTRASFLTYQIRSMNLEIERALAVIFAASGYALAEFYALRAHWGKGALSFTEISAHADLSEDDTILAITALIKKGLISQTKNTTTSITSLYELTALGTSAREVVMASYSDFITSLHADLSEQDMEQALSVMMKMHENVQADPVKISVNSSVISIF